MRRSVAPFAASFLLVIIMGAGCLPIPGEDVEKKQFVLDVSRPPGETTKASQGVLRVKEFRIAQQYEGRGFKYRVDHLTFQSDFYNEFFITPGQMIAEETRQWLDQSGMFKDVVGEDEHLHPSYILDGTIQELYGDYSSGRPKGVMAIRFVLIREVRGQSQVIFKQSYRQERPAPGKSAKELAKTWNEELFLILESLEKDLRSKMASLT